MKKKFTEDSLQSTMIRRYFFRIRPVNGKLSSVNSSSAFTLVELLVVVAIIIIISGVMLANVNKFGGQTLLQNLAYDIALSVREAQVYGIAVQSTGTSGSLTPGYGMYFSMTDPVHYHLFADTKNSSGQISPDGLYEAGEDVPPSEYSIGSNFKIAKLCATQNNVEDCTPMQLTIIFLHPEPDAWINPTTVPMCIAEPEIGGQYTEQCALNYSSARIVVTSPRGDFMSILVYSNGQISVKADPNGT